MGVRLTLLLFPKFQQRTICIKLFALFRQSLSIILTRNCRYNIGILATIYVNNGFIKALSTPTASQQGLITAIYYLGTWTCYVFISGPVSDKIGRRYSAMTGTVVSCVGAAMQAGAKDHGAFALMIIGRIICGFGNAIISTSVPLYQRLDSLPSSCSVNKLIASSVRFLRLDNVEAWSS